MANGPRLELRQKQSLVMMPQLQQAIKLLQMSHTDLIDYIEAELEKNPLLDSSENQLNQQTGQESSSDLRTDNQGETKQELNDSVSDQTLQTQEQGSQKEDPSLTHDEREPERQDLEELHLGERQGENTAQTELDTETDGLYDDPYGHASLHSVSASGQNTDSTLNPLENQSLNKSLKQHLTDQASVVFESSLDHAIALYLIDQVNENGYLNLSSEEIAERLGIENAEIEKVLEILQGLEPTGVMARSVEECLKLQLIERRQFNDNMQKLIENLSLLASSDYKRLARLCNVSAKELGLMITQLKALSPKPGLAYGSEVSPVVIPDVFIRNHVDGGWQIELNSESLPRLLINMNYYTEVNRKSDQKEKSFISECHKNASWLIKSLDQRAQTILKVTREIVRQQDSFLIEGIAHLKPLTLKDIAEKVDLHESTVSRVTANKYVSTPRGIFEMKFFFSSALPGAKGSSSVSSEAVRYHIKNLVTKETVDSVLSDDKIVERLQEIGIEIARRTVAKYREAMHIPSSAERRRQLQRQA